MAGSVRVNRRMLCQMDSDLGHGLLGCDEEDGRDSALTSCLHIVSSIIDKEDVLRRHRKALTGRLGWT